MKNENLKTRNGLICKKLGDEGMLYDPAQDHVHVLNITSLFIWNLLDGKHTLQEIETKLRENFTIQDGSDVLSDITKVIQDFKEKNLLE